MLEGYENHRMLGAIFSSAQLPDNGAGVPLGFGRKHGIWYLLIGRKTASASIADYMFYIYGQKRSASERSVVLTLSDEIGREFESAVKPVRIISVEESGSYNDLGFPTVMVDLSTGELMKGTNFNLGEPVENFIQKASAFSTGFPSPFHPDLNPFIKSLFLTRGLMLKPPLGRKFIMDNLVDDAYQHSVGIRKDTIKREFQELLRDLVASRVFKVKGKYITYLTDFTEYRRRFQRQYFPYIEKISKKTIFDYEGNPLY